MKPLYEELCSYTRMRPYGLKLYSPHQFFQEGRRASEERVKFDLNEVIVREKQNFATRLANLALQAVMDEMDIEHMQEALKFKVPLKLDRVMTGHIDILQVRNGAVHILDYKPAKTTKRERPITQLTLYALALSRLTGLRLYDFKCAWFDENAYYEFFPLHVVYKLRDRQRKEDPGQMKWDALVDPGVEKSAKDADIAGRGA